MTSMPKTLIRILALLLVPALIADPSAAALAHVNVWRPPAGQAGPAIASRFNESAIPPPALEGPQTNFASRVPFWSRIHGTFHTLWAWYAAKRWGSWPTGRIDPGFARIMGPMRTTPLGRIPRRQ